MKFLTTINITIAILIFAFAGINKLCANHLVGGDVTYEFVEFNIDSTLVTFDVIFNMYRDEFTTGTSFDADAAFGIYRQLADGSWETYDTDSERLGTIEVIAYEDDPCREEPTDVGVQSTTYVIRVILEVGDQNYMIAHQRCCRNESAVNIFSIEVGALFDVIITPDAQRTGNNSPTFAEYPPIFICAGFPLDVDVSGSDVDGDSLSYSFCVPFSAGGPTGGGGCNSPRPNHRICTPPFDNIRFAAPYTEEMPMLGDPVVAIDPITGNLSGVPTEIANYVIGLCITEYRDGEILSTIRRDFQFNALECKKEIAANLRADDVEIDNSAGVSRLVDVIKACGDSLVYFESTSTGIQLFSYTWNILDPNGDTLLYKAGPNATDALAELPELGDYFGTMIVNDGFDCPDTAFFKIERLPDMQTDFTYELLDSCYRAPYQLRDSSWTFNDTIVDWRWIYDNEVFSTDPNPMLEFEERGKKKVRLISQDVIGCRDTMDIDIDYFPFHDSLLTETPLVYRCFGDSLDYYGLRFYDSVTYDTIVTYIDTGCDSISSQLTLEYRPEPFYDDIDTVLCPGVDYLYRDIVYNEAGLYTYSTPSLVHGCDSILHAINIEIETLPQIDILKEFEYVVANQDYDIPLSAGGVYSRILWTPDIGLSCTDCLRPIVNSNIDTTYEIQLITDLNCRSVDSITLEFKVVPDSYFLPTVISDNVLNSNERLLYLQTIIEAYEDVTYDIKVMNRWGGLMHDMVDLRINEPTTAWDCRNIQPGTYAYIITVHEFFEDRTLVGTVTVL